VRFGLFVILTLFFALVLIQFPAPPRADLDASWSMVLVHAHRHGLQFGTDIAFTFGPLGFLISNVYFDGVPLSKYLWEVLGKTAFAATVIALGSSLPWVRFAFYYAALVLAALMFSELYTAYGVPLLALCWLLPGKAKAWQQTVALIWMVIFSAVRFNYCLEAVAAIAIYAFFHLLRGEWRKPLHVAAGYGIGFLGVWMLAGQSLRNLPAYFFTSWQSASGYAAAMSVSKSPVAVWWLGASLWILLATFALLLARKKVSAMETGMLLYFALVWFFLWKHGFTRADEGHTVLYFLSALILLSAVPPFFVSARRWTLLDLAPLVCLPSIWLCHPRFPGQMPQLIAQRLSETAREIFRPQASARRFAAGERKDKQIHGKPDLQTLVGRKSIDVFGHDQHEILREHLNYRPRPIFQSYAAYTPALLRLNLRYYESRRAPQMVFARLQSVDDRYPAQDDSLLLEELPRRYTVVRRAGDYVLLRRRRVQPAGELIRESLERREVRFGEEIALPDAADCSIELRAFFKPTLWGVLRSTAAQPARVSIVLTDAQNGHHTGRLVPTMAAAGFPVQPLLASQEDLSSFLEGRARTSVRSLRFEPEPGTTKCWSTIHIELYRLPELTLHPESQADSESFVPRNITGPAKPSS